MNSLVKSLILPFLTEVDSLDKGKTVGLFGGGFQPPTKGHFEVVKQAIENYKLNEFIIFVGTGGGRSDITQAQSLAIWNIYKNYLPGDVKIEASPNPVSSIYRYTKEHPLTHFSTIPYSLLKTAVKTWFWQLHTDIRTEYGSEVLPYDQLEATYGSVNLQDLYWRLEPVIKKTIDVKGMGLMKWINWNKDFKMLRATLGA
jgi:hypothetical protein